ncbi:hypothetical protein [Gemmatimonas sp.]|uniref:hypothetical protein n=1 Tax=Gemmatimonas sp. TaxID=1962908 RepID=UPI00286A7ADE|nr:hypothetical protein [Gemmatimonas sp.]
MQFVPQVRLFFRSASRAMRPSVRVPRLMALVSIVGPVIGVACADQNRLVSPNEGALRVPRDRPAFTINQNLEGPVPGREMVSIGVTDTTTGIDSAAFPFSYSSKTLVRITVIGKLARRYTTNITPQLYSSYAGQAY